MLEAVKKNQHDMVVTTKIDRLCRNLLDLLTLVDELESYHCGYASSSESFDTSSPAGRMVLQILGAFAEFERGRIRERVRDNMLSIVRNTDRAVARPIFGYEIVDRRYVVNEQEAQIVKQIAQWMLQGEGALKIAKRLNVMGVLTKDKKTFTANTVRKLMQRETLYGTFVYNRTTMRKGKKVLRPEKEWVIVDNHHEPIIDKQTFDKIQSVVSARTTSGKQADNQRWLLSGLVICKHCGKKMTGRHRKKPSGREYFHYVCRSYTTKGECFHHFIDRDLIEQEVITALLNIKENLLGDVKQSSNESHIPADLLSTTVIEQKLKSLDKKMQKQLELYEEDEISKDDFKAARDRIDLQRSELHSQLYEIENSKGKKQEEYVELVGNMATELTSDNRVTVKNAIRQLVHCVSVTDSSQLEIEFMIPQ